MKKEEFKVWEPDERVTLTVYSDEAAKEPRAAVIVVPGGAYVAPSERESDPVAKRFAELGYLGCVLRASTMYDSFNCPKGDPNPHTVFPEPLLEMGAAILFLRKNAQRFCLDAGKIALCGFSAGGHLTANYCNYWNSPEIFGALGVEADEIRPNADILCYAATMLLSSTPGAMHRAVLGVRDAYAQAELDKYNAKYKVGRETPPTFIWHTADDTMVFVRYSYDMAAALDDEGVPYELHVFSSGPHASGLSEGLPAACWPELADSFLKRYM